MPFAVIILISLLFFFIRYMYAKADLEAIKFIAFELGLEFQSIDEGGISSSKGIDFGFNKPSNWKISGNYENSFVEISAETRGSGRSLRSYIIICMLAINPLPYRIEIKRKGIIEKLFKKVINPKDILIGDEKFDNTFAVTGNNPEEIRKLCLNASAQKVIYNLVRISGFIILQDGIYYEEEGFITNLDFYRLTLSRMSMAVDTIYGRK